MFIVKKRVNRRVAAVRGLFFSTVVFALTAAAAGYTSRHSSEIDSGLLVQIDAPVADVTQAVQEVTNDQIVHGTYSYEKEKILYGAHAADTSRVLPWDPPGKAFYKVAERVLAPRFFKDSGDIGTITVRYVVQPVSPTSTSLRIDSIFIDARNEKHVSSGAVEAQEYAAIQEHLRDLQARRKADQNAAEEIARRRQQAEVAQKIASIDTQAATSSNSEEQSLERKIHELRRQVEMRVKSDAALRSAPFRGASTITSLPAETEVVVMIVTPYWYGVQTEDGHRGWVHHSELESLAE